MHNFFLKSDTFNTYYNTSFSSTQFSNMGDVLWKDALKNIVMFTRQHQGIIP